MVRSICAIVFTTSNGWVNVVDSVALMTPESGVEQKLMRHGSLATVALWQVGLGRSMYPLQNFAPWVTPGQLDAVNLTWTGKPV